MDRSTSSSHIRYQSDNSRSPLITDEIAPQQRTFVFSRVLAKLTLPLLLGLVVFAVYNANFRSIAAGDTYPARYLPLLLLSEGSVELSSSANLVAHGHPRADPRFRPGDASSQIHYLEPWTYWMIRSRDHKLFSLYPIVTPLLVTPLYLPAKIWLDSRGWTEPRVGRIARMMEKISASLLASIAVVVVFIILRAEMKSWSLFLALALGLGTNTWMISSQALWQHGTGELLIAIALWLQIRKTRSSGRLIALGFVSILIAANRPPDVFFAAAFLCVAFIEQPRKWYYLVVGAWLPLCLLMYYNVLVLGHIAGAYALAATPNSVFKWDISGIFGLLISPTKGLLVFSSFLLFVPLGIYIRMQRREERTLVIALVTAIALQLLLYAQADWRSGYSWGPRWLTDMLPVLVWLLAPVFPAKRGVLRLAVVITVLFSIGIQGVGAFWYTKTSDQLIAEGGVKSKVGAWKIENAPFISELRHSAAVMEFLLPLHGAIDRIGSKVIQGENSIPVLRSGDTVEGWGLQGRESLSHVLLVIDGIILGRTSAFSVRADVNQIMDSRAPSGWQIVVNTRAISPGTHTLQVIVLRDTNAEPQIMLEQQIALDSGTVHDELDTSRNYEKSISRLESNASIALSRLRERQHKDGFWLTSHTSSSQYLEEQSEINTFQSAMMIDTLAPIAERFDLKAERNSAKRHLLQQIEDGGLVRFHGSPATVKTFGLGCVITPDSDDSALAWRIYNEEAQAGSDPRAAAMLQTLSRYMDSRGLYRTWLASADEYQCVDPGVDPNPTDFTIQLHVYLLLRELHPESAVALCNSLQTSRHDEDLWVYYSKAPLIPYLRSVEVAQAGCPLDLPLDRLKLPISGQERWSQLLHLLHAPITSDNLENTRELVQELLAQISDNDFEYVRKNPPLLYHNDMTATVRRFYWSQDFGYVLWMRLFDRYFNRQSEQS